MKPLAGRTILVTRSREQAGELGDALAGRGARVVEAPVIALEDPEDWSAADEAVERLGTFDIVVFTSVNAVDRFCGRMARLGRELPSTGRPRIIAIGPATARALESRGLVVGGVASASRAEGVVDLLAGEELSGRRILIPRAEVARAYLPDHLRARGAQVSLVTVYRTVAVPVTPEVKRLIEARAVDIVTFTSSSTVTNLLAGIGGPETLRGIEIAVIGPVTARAVRETGLTPTIISSGTSMEDLADAIAARYAGAT